jgi:HD-like signal output (HDOD) protein
MLTAVNTTSGSIVVPPIVESSLRELRNIETLPMVVPKLMRLANDPDSSLMDVNEVIACDPALAARILKIVNSSFYGLPREIGSIDRAIVLLGLNAVKNIAIAASLDKVFRSARIGSDFEARDLWTHSVAVATGARELAVKAGHVLSDEAFLAGLIHDVGIMVEMQACREPFVQIISNLSNDPTLKFCEAEQQVLGATHEMFGAGLCRKWKFPVQLEYVAGFHHRPMQLDEADRTLPMIVHVADILAARVGKGYTRTVDTEIVTSEVLDLLKLGESDIDAVAEMLPDAIQEAQQMF